MKKLIFIFSLFFTSVLITNAAPCKVISGDGTNIGDEIQCGTENFYVLSNDGENVKMLAKYNLYVDRIYYKVEFKETFDTYSEAVEHWNDNYSNDYEGYRRFIINDSDEYYGALAYNYIEYEDVKQNELAIGAHGNLKVEPLFPEVAVYYDSKMDTYFHSAIEEEYYGGYRDFEIDKDTGYERKADLLYYLISYSEYLEKNGILASECTILTVKDINNIVYKITGEELPLEEWYNNKNNWGDVNSNYYDAVVVGSIKELTPEGYEWLWSTTYWTRTLDSHNWDGMYFVDTMGDLCNGEFCEVSVGAGIRPVVTIPAYLIYQIETKTDGNGTIEADHIEAEGGTVVKFTITPKEGYVLGEVKVTDANGNVVTFTDYTFIMPNANVLIEATFVPIPKKENPNTSDLIAIVCTLLVISGILLTFTNYKKTSLR